MWFIWPNELKIVQGTSRAEKMTLVWKNLGWSLARVQVATFDFSSFELRSWLAVPSRLCMCYFESDWTCIWAERSNFGELLSELYQICFQLRFSDSIPEISTHRLCTSDMQGVYAKKMWFSPSGHLHACKCPLSLFAKTSDEKHAPCLAGLWYAPFTRNASLNDEIMQI